MCIKYVDYLFLLFEMKLNQGFWGFERDCSAHLQQQLYQIILCEGREKMKKREGKRRGSQEKGRRGRRRGGGGRSCGLGWWSRRRLST